MARKGLIIILLIVAMGVPVHALPRGQVGGRPKIGIKAGLTISTWSGDDVARLAKTLGDGLNSEDGFTGWNFTSKSRYGFCMGAFIRYNVRPRFSIQPELLYSLKGIKYDGGGYFLGYPVNMDMTYRINYLEVPMLAVLSSGDQNSMGAELLFGPYLALKVSSKLKLHVEAAGESDDEEADLEDVKSGDFGVMIGVGFHVAAGIVMDARYGIGLMSVFEDTSLMDVANRGFSFSAGFCF